MKLVLGSDLHGHLPDVPECDILILAGDILPDSDQIHFIRSYLRSWLNKSPARYIIATLGNHDWIYLLELEFSDLRWILLLDEGVLIEGIYFYGTPWSLPGGKWAWQAPDKTLVKLYSFIPDNTDILISHSPPFGMCDRSQRGNVCCGSQMLRKRIEVLSNLKLVACGHVHEARGIWDKVINASSVDGHRQLRDRPWIEYEL